MSWKGALSLLRPCTSVLLGAQRRLHPRASKRRGLASSAQRPWPYGSGGSALSHPPRRYQGGWIPPDLVAPCLPSRCARLLTQMRHGRHCCSSHTPRVFSVSPLFPFSSAPLLLFSPWTCGGQVEWSVETAAARLVSNVRERPLASIQALAEVRVPPDTHASGDKASLQRSHNSHTRCASVLQAWTSSGTPLGAPLSPV